MSFAALALAMALAAKPSPAPPAPAGRKASDWAAYNKARAEAGLLPRKAKRGATRVSPSLVADQPVATPAGGSAPSGGAASGAPAPPAPATAAVAAPAQPPVLASTAREEPQTTRRFTPAQLVVVSAIRRAQAAAAAEARGPAMLEVFLPAAAPAAAAGESGAEDGAVLVAAPLAMPTMIPVPGVATRSEVVGPLAPARAPAAAPSSVPVPASAAGAQPRVARAERPRRSGDPVASGTGARLDAEGGSLHAGLAGAQVEVRLLARVGSMTVSVDPTAVALR